MTAEAPETIRRALAPFYECLACGKRFAFKHEGQVTCKCGGDRVKQVSRPAPATQTRGTTP